MNLPLIIVTYENPDLDGVSCGYAYEEYLNKTGQVAKFVLFGSYQEEVSFLMDKFNIPRIHSIVDVTNNSKIIIVDASDIRGLPKKIIPKKVIEVIDHRSFINKAEFPNAKFEIELVGSAATIIAEKFYKNKTELTHASAILLFYAIISNTINFKAKVTTSRDLIIGEWLKSIIGNDANYIKDIFEYKTQHLKVSKKSFLENHSAFFIISGKQIGIIQLEISNAKDFLKSNKSKCCSILLDIKIEFNLDSIFITIIDIFDEFNLFLTNEIETEQLLKNVINVEFRNKVAQRAGIIMRKEIVPLLTSHYCK